MEKITREVINKRLEKLRESRFNEESYTITKPAMAMCYSIDYIERDPAIYSCSECGKKFEIFSCSFDKCTIQTFEKIVEKYRSIGLDTELRCNCEECVSQKNCNWYEVRIKAADEDNWHISLPCLDRQCNGDEDRYTSDFEYELVFKFLTISKEIDDFAKFFDELYNVKFRERELKFYSEKPPINFYKEQNLTVARAIELIKKHTSFGNPKKNCDYIFYRFMSLFSEMFQELTYKGINGEKFVHSYKDAGFIKTQTDMALSKVLGLTVVYDIEEMRKNINFIFTARKMETFISQAYEILEQSDKQEFTVWEYSEFMKELYKIINNG